MRFILIPAPVAVEIPRLGPLVQPFDHFVIHTLLAQNLWHQNETWCRLAEEIRDTTAGLVAGSVLALTDEQHEALSECVRTINLNPQIAAYLLPLCRAILAASTKAPTLPALSPAPVGVAPELPALRDPALS